MKTRLGMLLIAILFICNCSALSVGVNPVDENTAIQAAASIAGYKVGANNPALVVPIIAHIDALLAIQASPQMQALFTQGRDLLLAQISDPAVAIVIQIAANSIQFKEGVPVDQAVQDKIKLVLSSFKTGLLMSVKK